MSEHPEIKFTFTGDPKAAPVKAVLRDRTHNHVIIDFEVAEKEVKAMSGGTGIHLNLFSKDWDLRQPADLYDPCEVTFEGFSPADFWCCSLGIIDKHTHTATFRRREPRAG